MTIQEVFNQLSDAINDIENRLCVIELEPMSAYGKRREELDIKQQELAVRRQEVEIATMQFQLARDKAISNADLSITLPE